MAEKTNIQEFVDDPVRCLETPSIRRSVHKNTPGRPDSDVPAAWQLGTCPGGRVMKLFRGFLRASATAHLDTASSASYLRVFAAVPQRLISKGRGSFGPPRAPSAVRRRGVGATVPFSRKIQA